MNSLSDRYFVRYSSSRFREAKNLSLIHICYQTEELPAFYTRTSGFKVDYRLDSPEELAEAFHVKGEMGLAGGMLVTNPIPEKYSMDPNEINGVIARAVEEARSLGIHGKETTPFLLAKIKDLSLIHILLKAARVVAHAHGLEVRHGGEVLPDLTGEPGLLELVAEDGVALADDLQTQMCIRDRDGGEADEGEELLNVGPDPVFHYNITSISVSSVIPSLRRMSMTNLPSFMTSRRSHMPISSGSSSETSTMETFSRLACNMA